MTYAFESNDLNALVAQIESERLGDSIFYMLECFSSFEVRNPEFEIRSSVIFRQTAEEIVTSLLSPIGNADSGGSAHKVCAILNTSIHRLNPNRASC